jgi:hypothetical protein
MRKVFEIGGIVAAVVLIAFGVVSIAMGISGNNTVKSGIQQEQITGSADMTPALIKAEAQKAGLKGITFPTCSVAGKAVHDGPTARCFAQYMRIHTLMATGGHVYSQMGMYVAKPGTPKSQLMPDGATDNNAYAVLDAKTQQPVANAARNIWVTETALTTALNVSYMASRLALFGIVMGVALLLTGIGFGILAVGGALESRNLAFKLSVGKKDATPLGTPVPTV